MKINKTQALYKALPHCWTTYSDSSKSDYKVACEVLTWNTKIVTGINEDIIRESISRRVRSFERAGGIVGSEFSPDSLASYSFVEAALNENIPDIVCKINPATFYCQKCDTVVGYPSATETPKCPKCGKKMSQLQMVYACECGFADGVKPLSKNLTYRSKDKQSQFRFYDEHGQKREMKLKCPVCGKELLPKNATDSRLFYSQSGNLVNLYNEKYSEALKKYKLDAELLVLAKYFGILTNEQFNKAIDSGASFFEGKGYDVNDPEVLAFAKALNKSPEEIVSMLSAQKGDLFNIDAIKSKIDAIFPISTISVEKLKTITSELLEFDSLQHPKSTISLEEGIQRAIDAGKIVDGNEIRTFLSIMGVAHIQISEQVQIVNYAYGYTRLRSCPDGGDGTRSLHLKAFDGKIFTTILNTEGILVEFDKVAIYKWLVANSLITGADSIENETDAKKWFIENIHLDSITHFSTIEGGYNLPTKAVYSLLHTISHMLIISSGKHSGLSRDSMSEILFPAACSIFIYPTSSEGVTLGSISGMFESDLSLFLEDALKDGEICTFDPICSTTQNGACVACTYLNEVNCTHFNKDLSRAYLYGGEIKINDEVITIKKGFWK